MSDYIMLPKLPAESVAALLELYSEFSPAFATSFRRRIGKSPTSRMRIGASGQSKLSVYKDTRWFKWSPEQRQRFKDAFPNKMHTKALVGYFIEFPKNGGFLDEMDAWADQGDAASVIIAHALKDGQNIVISGEKVVLNAGEGIAFKISKVHEVKPSEFDALWANTMVLGKLETFA